LQRIKSNRRSFGFAQDDTAFIAVASSWFGRMTGPKAAPSLSSCYLSVRASTPGSFFAFEELEAGAATGADVGDLVGYDLVLD
jgi:hypothetical protein